jgi:anti-sigma-K factor RskA
VEHLDELIAAHALHALDAEDERRLRHHLAECQRCRDELRDFEAVAGALAYAAPQLPAPDELRGRVLDALPEAPRPAAAPARRRFAWWPRVAAVAVPALAAAVVGLALWNVSLHRDLGSLHDHLATSTTAHMAGVGNLVALPGGKVTLYGSLHPAPAGKVYEAWVIRGGQPLPAGLFHGGTVFQLQLTQRARPGDVIAVTVEPADGNHSRPRGGAVGQARLRSV